MPTITIDEPRLRITYEDGSAREWVIAIDAPNNSVSVFSDTGQYGNWTHDQWVTDRLACLNSLDYKQAVPSTITASQARVALHRSGLLSAVTELVDNPATPQEIKIFWEYEVELNRDSPALNAMAATLGLTQSQIDDLFRAGSKIVV